MAETLEFFDCNARIGRVSVPHPTQFLDKASLLAEWDRIGIAGGLAYHALAQEWCPQEGNEALLGEIAGATRLYPVFVALPGATREMDALADLARRVRDLHGAVRLFPIEQQFRCTPWCCGDLLEALEEASVPLEIDITQTSWDDVVSVLAAFPRLHVILLGTYYRVDRYLYPLMEKHAALHVETHTYQTHRGIEAICERFGPERLIFGTNLPINEAGGAISQVVYAEIAADAKAAIAGGTMKRLLGLA